MDVSEVVKLVASGNFKDVELAWLSYVERDLISADEVIALERADPKLKRMQILAAGIAKKKGYNPLREIPMLDFMAPPTKVEQIVLDNLVDDYEFATPNKVDRCGTCHISAMKTGFEREKWPIQILDKNFPQDEKPRVFEEAVYRFTFDLLSAVWSKVKPGEKYPLEKSLMRDLEIHHATLGLLFKEYDDEDGEIGVREEGEGAAKKVLKNWRRWKRNGDEWTESDDGTSIAEYYLALLKRMRSQWLTHPHLSDMVGDASPHPYE